MEQSSFLFRLFNGLIELVCTSQVVNNVSYDSGVIGRWGLVLSTAHVNTHDAQIMCGNCTMLWLSKCWCVNYDLFNRVAILRRSSELITGTCAIANHRSDPTADLRVAYVGSEHQRITTPNNNVSNAERQCDRASKLMWHCSKRFSECWCAVLHRNYSTPSVR